MHHEAVSEDLNRVYEMAEEALSPEVVAFIEHCRQLERPESELITVLHKVQAINGWLSAKQLDAVALLLGVPGSQVSGVASFYHFFRLKERGRNVINVCLGTACYVKGAQQIIDKITELKGIVPGETTPDGKFTLDASRCLGTCGLAPVVVVNDHVHAGVKPEDVEKLLSSCK
ncbi:MAG: NADH-quinone oxidoreductase subunit NuoE [Sedimentisphaerales bacterium]|nr:NADH-quinone oxidoreductase subunit NuoE [Sedimentisphaerales bacterium]